MTIFYEVATLDAGGFAVLEIDTSKRKDGGVAAIVMSLHDEKGAAELACEIQRAGGLQ